MLRRDGNAWIVVDFQLPFTDPDERSEFVEMNHRKKARNGWQKASVRVKRKVNYDKGS